MFVVVPALFFAPGLLLCAAVGLRGWRLAAVAPAVTFGLVATGSIALDVLGLRWSLGSFAGWTVAVALVLAGVRVLLARRSARRQPAEAPVAAEPGPARRGPWEHVVVGAGVVAGMVVGAVAFLRGTGGLGTTSQEWDAPFHANAVRWIAEHGTALPGAISPIANVPAGDPYYYPVTFHALLALLVEPFGVTPSWLLNAAALTAVLIWPLAIAALGMSWRVPAPVVAVAAAVSTWFSAFPFDSLWRGPLWPYVAGLAMLPGVLAAGRMLLERGPLLPTVVAIALGVTGVVAMHPSLAFVLLVYVVALAAAMVLGLERVRWRELTVPLVVTGAATVAVLLPVVVPARTASVGVQSAEWPEFASQAEGFGQVLLFSPTSPQPQWWLGLTALAGLVVMVRRRRLLWVLGAYVVFGAAYAGTASMNNGLVNAISGPFYNDAWRFAALLPLVGAFAVGEALVALGGQGVRRWRPVWGTRGVLAASAGLLVVLALLGNGAYVQRNVDRLGISYGHDRTVSQGEIAAYEWLADHLQPGEQVMNDRLDGSVWMYAVAGVEPMEWTFYGVPSGSPIEQLYERLNRMDGDAGIRELLAEERVRYVVVGEGFVRDWVDRAPGLRRLDGVDGLERVYDNDDAAVYEVVAAG
jgi:MYXO-CTERM domain-containing protein